MTRTFATLRQMSLHGSRRRPIVCAIEDLHLSDQTSEACFAMLVKPGRSAHSVPPTYRPGLSAALAGKSYATQIALHHLLPQESIAVVLYPLPLEKRSEELVQAILSKAEGNPFFWKS